MTPVSFPASEIDALAGQVREHLAHLAGMA
jgi:hypothetical protein